MNENPEKSELELLKLKSDAIRQKQPEHVPVIIKRSKHTNIPELLGTKYIVPGDCTVEQFLKKLVEKKPDNFPANKKQIYLFIGNVLVNTKALFSDLDKKYKSKDGFLHMTYSGEYTWGKFSSTFLNLGQSS